MHARRYRKSSARRWRSLHPRQRMCSITFLQNYRARSESSATRWARNRTRGAFTCPLTVRCPIGGGIHAPELHGDSPEAVYAHTPGLKVVMPSRPYDAKGLLISAIRDPDPVIFFEPKFVYQKFKEEVPEEEYTLPIGRAKVVSEGRHVTVVTWGAMVFECLK